ncbi:MAG: general secretion pathway protein GspK [Syntrophobacteraceae bacterium]|nr:general secretion pathway protein GspK [Syntrophobacteraceae bacterium]
MKGSTAVGQNGIVIIAVLWICALIMWFAIQIGAETRLEGEEQALLVRKSQALHLAVGGCFEALARMGQPLPLRTSDAGEDNWQPDGKPHLVNYGTGQALVIVEREDLKVNVNVAREGQIKAVLEKAGIEPDASDRLAGLVVDFIDKDDIPTLHGAEASFYRKLGLPYEPFNGPLTRIEQMLLIPGITRRLFFGEERTRQKLETEEALDIMGFSIPPKDSLFQMFTVYGRNTRLQDQEPEAESRTAARVWAPGGLYRILSCGKAYSGFPAVTLCLVVQFTPDTETGYKILYRKVL